MVERTSSVGQTGSSSSLLSRHSAWAFALPFALIGGLIALTIMPQREWRWILPVSLLAPLILVDVVRWARREYDTFDPVGVFSLLGAYFFVVQPFVIVVRQAWPTFLPQVDWTLALTQLAWLNFIGLVAYRLVVRSPTKLRSSPDVTIQRLPGNVKLGAQVGLVIAITFQVLLWQRFGGLTGYLSAIEDRRQGTLDGLGQLLAIAESAPIFVAILYVHRRQNRNVSPLEVGLFFFGLSAFTLVTSGLRGSRSNIFWALLIALILVHRYVKRVTRTAVLLCAALAIVFAYAYGFYKAEGASLFQDLSTQSRVELEAQTGRTFETVLVSNVGKTAIQTWVLGRLEDPSVSYEYAFGQTYISAVALPVRTLIRFPTIRSKNSTALDLRFASEENRDFRNSQVFGLAGEAMLNFGPIAVPFAYTLLAFTMLLLRRLYFSGRIISVALSPIVGLILLNGDLDNVMFFLVKNGAFPALVLASTDLVLRQSALRRRLVRPTPIVPIVD